MATVSAPPPIPGQVIDPPPKETPELVERLDDASDLAGIGYRAFNRFSFSKASLLAAGTTYYAFLALFSVIALGYGIAALVGGAELASYLTDAVNEAFPGLVGDEGIDADQLRAIGQATSAVGLLALLYSAGGIMVAASASIHLVYGAPPDPRNFFLARARLLGWFALVGPLVMISYVASTVVQRFADPVLDWLGLDSTVGRVLLTLLTMAATLALNFLVAWVLLGVLGGIRPPSRARLVGAAISAVLVEVLKFFMAWIIDFSVDKPEYGAFAAPIAVLLVLYLQAMVLYGSAAVTAGIAERDVPLEELVPNQAADASAPSEGGAG